MCGIAGIAVARGEAPPTEGLIRAMCDTIVHRGPDEEGIHVQDDVGLGARRLSIIDVAGGHQPYFDESRRVRAVFNGEIYNFQELRSDLAQRGHRFASGTDGEVIVHLWEEHGADFVRYLNGMFAIALHDAKRRRLVLARDRLGIKPLYYSLGPKSLLFGSEIKAILAAGGVEKALDLAAAAEFLAWEYVPSPGTLIASVRKLEPAAILELDLERFAAVVHRWWDLPAPRAGDDVDDREWEERVDAAARTAVRRQLVSDVPLGAFLSGGVDSSLVVAHMGPTKAFSIGFEDPTYSEVEWATRAAAHLGVEHRVEVIQPDVVGMFDRLMHFMDDPIGDFSIFPTYLISRHARSAVTVALSGDGGDELFGGYETYAAQQYAALWRRLPRFVRGSAESAVSRARPRPRKKGLINKAKRFVEGLGHPERLGHARWRLFAGRKLREALFTPDALQAMGTDAERHILALREDAGDRSSLDQALYTDVRSYLTDNCLLKVDRMSMACSLEVRVPLLDHELAELAFRIPDRLKVRRGRTKPLLKRVTARHVPDECVYRPKEGFSIPIKHWLLGPLRPLLEELLDADRVRADGIFRPETVNRLKVEHLGGEANHSHVLWSLMVLHDWRARWKV